MKLLEAWDEYLAAKRAAERTEGTLKEYQSAIDLLVRDVKNIELADITTQMIQNHLNERYKKASTRRKRKDQLSAFFNWCAVKREWIKKSPTKALDTVTVERGGREPFTPAELEKLRSLANPTELTAIEYLLFLRPNEFLTAEFKHVTPEAKSMMVYRRKLHTWQNIEITDEMIQSQEGLKKWGGAKSDKELANAEFRLIRWFKRFTERAGMPENKQIPYILRHTGATMWAAKYRDPFRLMNQMGWDDVQRAATYVHQAERSAWAAVFPRVDLTTISEKLDKVVELLEKLVR